MKISIFFARSQSSLYAGAKMVKTMIIICLLGLEFFIYFYMFQRIRLRDFYVYRRVREKLLLSYVNRALLTSMEIKYIFVIYNFLQKYILYILTYILHIYFFMWEANFPYGCSRLYLPLYRIPRQLGKTKKKLVPVQTALNFFWFASIYT